MGRNQWFEIWGFNVRRSPDRQGRPVGNDGRDAEREPDEFAATLDRRPVVQFERHGANCSRRRRTARSGSAFRQRAPTPTVRSVRRRGAL